MDQGTTIDPQGSQSDQQLSQQQPRQSHSTMSTVLGRKLALILTLLTLLGSLFAAYIIYLATASPSPPQLAGAGSAFAVSSST